MPKKLHEILISLGLENGTELSNLANMNPKEESRGGSSIDNCYLVQKETELIAR